MVQFTTAILGLSLLASAAHQAVAADQGAARQDCTGFPAAYDDDGRLLSAFLDSTQKWSAFEASVPTDSMGGMSSDERARLLRENTEYVSAIGRVIAQNIEKARSPRTRSAFQTLQPIYAEIQEINAVSARVMAAESVNDMQLIVALSASLITSQARFLAMPVLDYAELQLRKDYVVNTAIPHERQLRLQARDVTGKYITDFRGLIGACYQAGPLSRDY